ncbi:alpha/beta hydrolase [Pseudonocardia sp. KRD-184]|uniref:Alpha/beta hydrolase n=1 Tax=Pseudonocardia oceani TaxID=2792013 RepID=A0ABS6U4I2_9PSEU|nr:alpha/beta hydrolase [Pseudonocardia oceani]MBW0092459.1 alpha/beta hydrolase [Pseudonocardia oceani]MBW0099389.1 alpha/beta hydrolase [Pseudonocardia oceani]MBW0125473.1 alpha/beta hydrolase [Pseudonocardia oceani]MBW0127167.1 alpha/beta hydrolase [Pseudonocardia oceani]
MTSHAIDPELAAVVPMLPQLDLSDLPSARASMTALVAQLGTPDATGVRVEEVSAPGPEGSPDVRMRVYRPERVAAPAAVYDVHGGGFVLGDLETDHARNLEFARELGVVVVSVDYRLAPETPFPGPLEDVYAGLVWTAKNASELGVDPERIAVHGVSAGGGLAAGLTLLARDRGGPSIAFQYLGVPEVDDRLTTSSMTAFTDTPIWNRSRAVVSWDSYLGAGVPGSDDVSPYAAPARATDLSGLPPAYVSAMHFDPLRDEGIAYALALLAAGVTVELHLFPGTFHGSGLARHAAVSQREHAEATAVLARALGL